MTLSGTPSIIQVLDVANHHAGGSIVLASAATVRDDNGSDLMTGDPCSSERMNVVAIKVVVVDELPPCSSNMMTEAGCDDG